MNPIRIEPGTNRFEIIRVQEFGTVEPKEYTETGYPKNTCTKFGELEITFDEEKGTFSVKPIPMTAEDW